MKHEVVVTGYGIVSSIGVGIEAFGENLFAGKSGVHSIRGSLAPQDFPVPYAAWIPRDVLPPSDLFGPGADKALKSWLMTEIATTEALKFLTPENHLDAIIYGTADGVSYEMVEEILKTSLPSDFDYQLTRSESSVEVAGKTAENMGFRKVDAANTIAMNGACASGNQTLGLAYQGLRAGRWNRVMVGGVDARCEANNFMNFFLLGALTTEEVPPETASRPFAKDRSGFVRGEGAATLILETREAAEKRGAKILGVMSGYGCTSDAYRLTDGREDGSAVIEAIEQAVRTSGLDKSQIDYINAHGTATPLNDRLETKAIKTVFGERSKQIPVSSIKSQIGHSTIAASAIEAIACLLMLERQVISPTLNYHQPDPDCDLDFVPNVSRAAKINHVLSNSFGFGGQNTCAVFSKVAP